jgi:hypothetical protein
LREVTIFGKLSKIVDYGTYGGAERKRAIIGANEGHGGVFAVGCRMEGWRGKHFSL